MISKKKNNFNETQKQSLSRPTFLLHETPNKNRQTFFKGVGEKSHKEQNSNSKEQDTQLPPVLFFNFQFC